MAFPGQIGDATMSTAVGALKNVYDNYVERQQNLKHRAIDEIAKSLSKYSPGGNGYFGAINDAGNESIGAIGETEQFRSIDSEDYQQWKVVPKVMVAPIEFSGLVAAAAEGDEESFVGIVVDALDLAKERLLKDENRQFYGMGTGSLCVAASSLSAAATNFTVDSVQYLRENMVLDWVSSGTTTVTAASARIIKLDRVNQIVYLSTSLTHVVASGDFACKENIQDSAASDGKEMMGLRGIVDDATDVQTFQNIDRNTYTIWRARRIDASSANLTSDLLQRLIDDVAVSCGEEPNKLIMHRRQRRSYLNLVVPQKRYASGDMDSGFSKLEFNGMELWLDYDCQTDTVYAINLDKIRKFELQALGMGKHDGSDTFLRKSNFDIFQAYWRHYCNFGTSQSNAHGKIKGLAVPTGLA